MRGVALVGTMGSGKTTAASFFCELFDAHRVSVATELKRLAVELFAMHGKNRELLQQLGSALRNIDADVFVRCVHRELAQLESQKSDDEVTVVVDDVRFENEFDYFRKMGFVMIYISREPLTEQSPESPESHESHESEAGVPALARRCDVFWLNDRGLEDLRELVSELGARHL